MVDRKWNIEDDTSTPWACGFVGEALLQGNRLFGSYSDHAQGDEFIDSMTDEKPIQEPEIVLEGEELEALVNEFWLAVSGRFLRSLLTKEASQKSKCSVDSFWML